MRNPTNIRFDAEQVAALSEIASVYGISKADLVRAAVAAKLPEWELGGVILQPIRRKPYKKLSEAKP
ncbi:MAG: hypothetical protein PHP44_15755 [Kiritimatiellae bacterium]|nr:hypothetical protein [Kiritimatiellia bacterium]